MKIRNYLLILITFNLSACLYNNYDDIKPNLGPKVPPCILADTISYSKHVVPFLQTNCGSQDINCHSTSAVHSHLDNYQTVSAINSSMLASMNWDGSAPQMPKDRNKLDSCSIALFQKWVNQGALNN